MKAAKLFLLLFYLFQALNSQDNQIFYRCGVDDDNFEPLPATNFVPIEEDKRKLNDDEFKDFHIYLDLINIKNDIKKFHLEEHEELFIDSLNKAVETLQSLLKVRKLKYGYSFTDEQIKNIKIDDWNKTMIGNNSIGNSKTLDIDLFIFGRFDNQMNPLTLASAGPRYSVPETG